MFDAVPGCLERKEAAIHIAKGYELETDTKWVVVYKDVDCDTGTKRWYKACEEECLSEAMKEGYKLLY